MDSKKSPQQLSIRRLLNTSFVEIYKKLVLRVELNPNETVKILSIAVILANQEDMELNRLGYRIVLSYGNMTGDYIPLYDISINTGLMPVADLTKKYLSDNEKKLVHSTFIGEFTDSFVDAFRQGKIVQTEQQLILNKVFHENIRRSIYVVAPTSYGKSELILSTIKTYPNEKICILVPSKSLLAQTKKRLLDGRVAWVKRIVTHPEMHDDNVEDAIYILTQERLSRLLNIDPELSFNFLFVDEAHNLLDNESRNKLLASVISVLNFRNQGLAIKYLTPFLKDTSNLDLRSAVKVELNYLVEEYVKTERFYIADYRAGKKINKFYDQFTNDFYANSSAFNGSAEYILGNATQKNIVYFNKPKDIEKFVLELIDSLEPIEDPEIATAIEELGNSLDQEYLLVECLRRGVVYHHGSMTDSVRHYVEFLFRRSEKLNFLVSSSTLLEGVNMPIERLFLMSCAKGRSNLTASQFKNLVGRVNRFSEIFSGFENVNLQKLEPAIHIVAQDGYMSQSTNLKTFLKNRAYVLKSIKDNPKNVLLEKTEIVESNKEDFNNAISRLENLENGIIDDYDQEYVSTDVGKLLIASNVSEIDVFVKEQQIQNVLDEISEQAIADSNTLMDVVYRVFIQFGKDDIPDNQLSRLQNVQAQTFYAMMLDWKIAKTPFKLMIRRFIDYWDQLSPDTQVYVGKWGDEINEDGGHREHYTQISRKSRKEKINLAIVRIKEEEDFIEQLLFRFIDILYDLNFVEEEYFKRVKYGTTNETTISLIKHGLSRGVAELVLSEYREFIDIDTELRIVQIAPTLPEVMRAQGESILQIFEVEMNTMAQG